MNQALTPQVEQSPRAVARQTGDPKGALHARLLPEHVSRGRAVALGLTGTTVLLVRLFGLGQGTVIPFPAHGAIEKWTGPAFLATALLTGGARRARNLSFLLGHALLATIFYNVTDWEADPNE